MKQLILSILITLTAIVAIAHLNVPLSCSNDKSTNPGDSNINTIVFDVIGEPSMIYGF